jgi:carbamoylphosphate synthase small subunit
MQVQQKKLMEIYRFPHIGQKQRRPTDGAQFHPSGSATPVDNENAKNLFDEFYRGSSAQ